MVLLLDLQEAKNREFPASIRSHGQVGFHSLGSRFGKAQGFEPPTNQNGSPACYQ